MSEELQTAIVWLIYWIPALVATGFIVDIVCTLIERKHGKQNR